MDLFSVLVTGASRGIGLEFVRQLAKLKSPPKHIFAAYRNKNNIQDLKVIQNEFQTNTKIHLIKIDVTNEEDINNAEKFVRDVVQEEGLTLLISNAGLLEPQPFQELTADNLNLHFNTNTIGPLLLTQIFYPLLKKSAEKREGENLSFSRAGILNISSIGGSSTLSGKMARELYVLSYKISKTALNMGMRVIATDAKNDNVMIVMMCPGWVKTDLGTTITISEEDLAKLEKIGYKRITPEESVTAIINTLTKLTEEQNGTFIDRFGKPIPY